jgi:FtsX extracellular domain
MHDLDIRLERLAAEATRDAVPPEPEAVARRGRRRRRRQVAGSALVVAVVATGLALPGRLTGRPEPVPATAPATDVSGAGMLTGHWFGKADAAVFLSDDAGVDRREAIRHRLEALDVVDQVFFESRREAYDRLKVLYRNRPELQKSLDPAILPESFRVRLDDPAHFKRLYLSLCQAGLDASGDQRCVDGVDGVFDSQAALKPLLAGKPWLVRSSLTVFLPDGTTAAEREAVRARLEAIDGVAKVVYESPAQAFRRLPEKWRKPAGDKFAPVLGPEAMHGSFRVTLEEPARIDQFHRALCGGRRTGDCPFGLVLLDHRPREDQAGAGAGSVRVRP